jgi:hypothetical protein
MSDYDTKSLRRPTRPGSPDAARLRVRRYLLRKLVENLLPAFFGAVTVACLGIAVFGSDLDPWARALVACVAMRCLRALADLMTGPRPGPRAARDRHNP